MSQDLRKAYLDFFKSKGHTIVPSDSLVPSSDPTLLFTSAGMVQFKAHFLQQIPLTFTRAASSQRCLRTTDIDSVGLTARHLTFFEMLGNFSFGDYFKEDAISWAWEFFTRVVGLPKDRLWISIYRDDEEALGIWKKLVPESRIVRMGEDSNFWTMGPTGPCGPCSEIYWDKTGKGQGGPDDSDNWMEVWNLVFTQFDRQADGSLKPLPKKNIDTGMGLERLTSVVEGVTGNFDTSLLKPLVRFGESKFDYKYGADAKKDVSLRIVADHLRAVTFLIFDGILPSNEGRGYVLRRLLRRATRQGTLFGKKDPFLYQGVPLVAELMKSTAPDLPGRVDDIATRIREEEERFLQTMETGLQKLTFLIDQKKKGVLTAEDLNTVSVSKTFAAGETSEGKRVEAKGSKEIPGSIIFDLYETYGFPPEVTKEILDENNLTFDKGEFDKAREAAQERAREGWKGSGAKDVTVYNELKKKIGASSFRGYDAMSITGPILGLLKDGKSVAALGPGETGEVVAAATPFYPEGGGQVGDKGFLKDNGQVIATVTDTQKPVTDLIVHSVATKAGLKIGQTVEFAVDPNHRNPTRRHHTATHLLHAALRRVLGKTVTQAGSLVAPDRLRFDYTYSKPLTAEQIRQVEDIVNDAVLRNMDVTPKVFPAEEAKRMGAMALFGEKYGNEVRCLLVSEKGYEDFNEAFSLELCGGTHVSASGDIGAFKIISDGSLAAGVRRIEAVAGTRVIEYLRGIERSLFGVAEKLKTSPDEAESRINKMVASQRQLEQEVRDLKLKVAQGGSSASSAPETREINGVPVAIKVSDGLDAKDLRTLADRLKAQAANAVVFVASVTPVDGKEKVSFVVAVPPSLKARLDAGKVAKTVAARLGGSGGGRSDFAQGGGEGRGALDALLADLGAVLS